MGNLKKILKRNEGYILFEGVTAFAIIGVLIGTLLPLLIFLRKNEKEMQRETDYYRYLYEATLENKQVISDGVTKRWIEVEPENLIVLKKRQGKEMEMLEVRNSHQDLLLGIYFEP